MSSPPTRRTAILVVLLAAGTAGCGVPPEARRRSSATLPAIPPPSASATAGPGAAPAPPSRTPTRPEPTGFPPGVAVDCQGNPGGNRVIDLLRGAPDLLPAGAQVAVTIGPLCADTWQYTVVTVPGRESLQVVSNGPAADLNLITAGTDVCNIPVRTIAPPGIRAIACDGAPPPIGPPGGAGL